MLSLSRVSKRFGSTPVLDGVSFDIAPGEIVGLLGPNGSGKTTTIRLVNGVIEPASGQIRLLGFNPVRDGDAVRRRTGILTETAGFYLRMSGLENLRFFAELYGVTDRRRPERLLEQFGLGPNGHQPVGAYSTGMKKRLGLAKALLHRPQALFLDEPTNGLDPEGIRMVLGQIRELNRQEGTTIMLCSHLLQQLETVCHRYLFLQPAPGGARLIEQGTLPELEQRYGGEVLLLVESNLVLDGESYGGVPARPVSAGKIEFRLASRAAVPGLLRRLAAEADLFSAAVVNADLESIYFRIREVAGA